MAQASSFKPSIHYQVCNSNIDNDIPCPSSIKSSRQATSSNINDDLCEIKISPSTSQQPVLPPSSSNHYSPLPKHFIPTTSATSHVRSSIEYTGRNKPTKYPFPSNNPRGSSVSIQSIPKRLNTQQGQFLTSSNPSSNRHSISRQSIFDTLATTLTAVRKSSTSAFALAQQRLSTDNGNIFSAYQGKTDEKQRKKKEITTELNQYHIF